ncbi:hypothetical protein SAMN04487946_11942 [Halobellus clavatus]|uniref:Uncharacterized protein n=1 Tax=Halobellus clavatus TaxID=660517 RepID=A0A1H3KGG0_9EURY|nr:hypothetical protein SAMN04487946_11942 [Halobellus clavatus]
MSGTIVGAVRTDVSLLGNNLTPATESANSVTQLPFWTEASPSISSILILFGLPTRYVPVLLSSRMGRNRVALSQLTHPKHLRADERGGLDLGRM